MLQSLVAYGCHLPYWPCEKHVSWSYQGVWTPHRPPPSANQWHLVHFGRRFLPGMDVRWRISHYFKFCMAQVLKISTRIPEYINQATKKLLGSDRAPAGIVPKSCPLATPRIDGSLDWCLGRLSLCGRRRATPGDHSEVPSPSNNGKYCWRQLTFHSTTTSLYNHYLKLTEVSGGINRPFLSMEQMEC